MKPDTVFKCMYAVTALFVCAALAAAAVSLANPARLSVVWSDELSGTQEWLSDGGSLREELDTLFPARERETSSTEILPNFDTLVNINTASCEELCTLPGIGDALANRIIAYREEHGLFAAAEELMNVSGIGEKKFEAIRERITLESFQ